MNWTVLDVTHEGTVGAVRTSTMCKRRGYRCVPGWVNMVQRQGGLRETTSWDNLLRAQSGRMRGNGERCDWNVREELRSRSQKGGTDTSTTELLYLWALVLDLRPSSYSVHLVHVFTWAPQPWKHTHKQIFKWQGELSLVRKGGCIAN